MRTLGINPELLRPLPTALLGMPCESCIKHQSVWAYTQSQDQPTGTAVCSLCWLYKSRWAEEQGSERIEAFIGDVESLLPNKFQRDSSGRVSSIADADRLVSAIALTSRLFYVRGDM